MKQYKLRSSFVFAMLLALILPILAACGGGGEPAVAPTTAPAAAPTAPERTTVYEPSRALDGLFHDVQLAGVFPDSKTFVDARPLEAPAQITAAYSAEKSAAGFSLRTFVDKHFEMPHTAGGDFAS